MKLLINKDKLTSENSLNLNSGSIRYYEIEINFDESWKDLIKECKIIKNKAIKGNSISVINNKIFVDREFKGLYYIGFIGYTIKNNEKIYQISTNLIPLIFSEGCGEIETENDNIPPLNEWEIYIAQIQEMINGIETLPDGGVKGQVLTKKSNANGDVEWKSLEPISGEVNNYEKLQNKPIINNVILQGSLSLNDLGIINFSGNYNDLTNKPDIPSEITEQTVENWGFTKNIGTITEIIMNGISKGTNGIIDLGTVITRHQSLADYELKPIIETPSGSSVTITPENNKIYQCGELADITITNPPATGAYSIIFTSGDTATTTVIPNTMLGLEDFAAEANTVYEINVFNNRAVVGSWAVSV